MVSPVREDGDAITCSQIFTLRLREIHTGNSTERGFMSITIYIRGIGFSDMVAEYLLCLQH